MISNKDELKTRLEAKRAELEARLKQLKADAQGDSRKSLEEVEAGLGKVRDALSRRWDEMSEDALGRINDLLRDDSPTS